jgi:sulfur-carrier protein
MPTVVLASALARWIRDGGDARSAELALAVAATSLDGALNELFVAHPTLRGYVFDDAGRVRHHVAVFIDGDAIRDKTRLDVALGPSSEIYIAQALSGG